MRALHHLTLMTSSSSILPGNLPGSILFFLHLTDFPDLAGFGSGLGSATISASCCS